MRQQEAVVVTAAATPEEGCDGEQPRQLAGLVCRAPGVSQEPHKQWKKFLYCEPHKRIKEVLEEELYIKRDECHIKNPPSVVLEGIWSIKRNLPVGGLKPGLPSRNSLLPQAKYYSRHGGLRSSSHQPGSSEETNRNFKRIIAVSLTVIANVCQEQLWQNVGKVEGLTWEHSVQIM
ncbi:uncharacterized protein C11orf97 homolog [Urocitellus parryii]|uniref:uncharacterized protein C11orf97 homolog n=1 Tax=Urocitellus parryii TaxID=9999 RepID=UPI000E55D7DD|nr:uncharacterized protein C11orf97 homolog [Urocitellus parryii]